MRKQISHQPPVTCQVGDEAVMNVFHEDLPPDVDEVVDVRRLFVRRLHAVSSSVVTQIPRLHRTDEMRHFRRLAKPLAHNTPTPMATSGLPWIASDPQSRPWKSW